MIDTVLDHAGVELFRGDLVRVLSPKESDRSTVRTVCGFHGTERRRQVLCTDGLCVPADRVLLLTVPE